MLGEPTDPFDGMSAVGAAPSRLVHELRRRSQVRLPPPGPRCAASGLQLPRANRADADMTVPGEGQVGSARALGPCNADRSLVTRRPSGPAFPGSPLAGEACRPRRSGRAADAARPTLFQEQPALAVRHFALLLTIRALHGLTHATIFGLEVAPCVAASAPPRAGQWRDRAQTFRGERATFNQRRISNSSR